mmetsp:Transcript_25771/g.67499  ORF Transcript_25771/g.67499 Transcript_25771/m.67499 type:complete len:388 (+) Transcript_25771:221-1384(+)
MSLPRMFHDCARETVETAGASAGQASNDDSPTNAPAVTEKLQVLNIRPTLSHACPACIVQDSHCTKGFSHSSHHSGVVPILLRRTITEDHHVTKCQGRGASDRNWCRVTRLLECNFTGKHRSRKVQRRVFYHASLCFRDQRGASRRSVCRLCRVTAVDVSQVLGNGLICALRHMRKLVCRVIHMTKIDGHASRQRSIAWPTLLHTRDLVWWVTHFTRVCLETPRPPGGGRTTSPVARQRRFSTKARSLPTASASSSRRRTERRPGFEMLRKIYNCLHIVDNIRRNSRLERRRDTRGKSALGQVRSLVRMSEVSQHFPFAGFTVSRSAVCCSEDQLASFHWSLGCWNADKPSCWRRLDSDQLAGLHVRNLSRRGLDARRRCNFILPHC